MEQIELKSKISEYKAEQNFAMNRAQDATKPEDIEIWEIIEVAYADLCYKLNKFLKK